MMKMPVNNICNCQKIDVESSTKKTSLLDVIEISFSIIKSRLLWWAFFLLQLLISGSDNINYWRNPFFFSTINMRINLFSTDVTHHPFYHLNIHLSIGFCLRRAYFFFAKCLEQDLLPMLFSCVLMPMWTPM